MNVTPDHSGFWSELFSRLNTCYNTPTVYKLPVTSTVKLLTLLPLGTGQSIDKQLLSPTVLQMPKKLLSIPQNLLIPKLPNFNLICFPVNYLSTSVTRQVNMTPLNLFKIFQLVLFIDTESEQDDFL